MSVADICANAANISPKSVRAVRNSKKANMSNKIKYVMRLKLI